MVERAEKLNKQNLELQYHAAWSNECMEFWFLLHFAYYTSNNHRSEYKKFINGKQEISDFLAGQRREKDETEWLVVERPELRIIEDEVFEKAQEILRERNDAFNLNHERQSNKFQSDSAAKK